MKFKIIAIVLYVISTILFMAVLADVVEYFREYQSEQSKHAEASDLIEGTFGIFVVSAVFFFLGRIFFKKWKQDKAVAKALYKA